MSTSQGARTSSRINPNTHPLMNISLISRISSFFGNGIELNIMLNLNRTARDAIMNHSHAIFDKLISPKIVEKDAKRGDITIALEILRRGQEFKWQKVLRILFDGDFIHELNDLFTAGADINTHFRVNYDTFDLLHWSCFMGKPRMFNMLMEHKPNLKLHCGKTNSLLIAIKGGNLKIIAKLLALGVDIHPETCPESAFHVAAQIRSIQILQLLINSGGNINSVDRESGFTCMHWVLDRPDLIMFLLDNGLDLNIGKSLFNILVKNLKPAVLELFLARGLVLQNIDSCIFDTVRSMKDTYEQINNKGVLEFDTLSVILKHAVKTTGKKASHFLEYEAKIPETISSCTALGNAILFASSAIISLIKLGADRSFIFRSKGEKFCSDYELCIIYAKGISFKYLVDFDAENNIPIPEKVLALCLEHKFVKGITELSRINYNFNRSGRYFECPPLSKVLSNNAEISKVRKALLQTRYDINYRAGSFPPLHIAIKERVDLEVVRELMNKGANANVRPYENKYCRSSFALALSFNNCELLSIIVDKKYGKNRGDYKQLTDKELQEDLLSNSSNLAICCQNSDDDGIDLINKTIEFNKMFCLSTLLSHATANKATRLIEIIESYIEASK